MAFFPTISVILLLTASIVGSTALAAEATTQRSAPPKLFGNALVDYTAASEYTQAHYDLHNYFGGTNSIREEPIYDARQGVLTKDGKVQACSLDECGFQSFKSPTNVQNFEDLNEVRSVYLEELRSLIPKALSVDPDEIESIAFWNPVLRGEEVPTNGC